MYDNNNMKIINNQFSLQDAINKDIIKKIADAVTDADNISKEKYESKKNLIETANDMTTKEKLDAMDQNSDQLNRERWQNIIYYGVISFGIISLSIGSPTAIKNIHKMLTA